LAVVLLLWHGLTSSHEFRCECFEVIVGIEARFRPEELSKLFFIVLRNLNKAHFFTRRKETYMSSNSSREQSWTRRSIERSTNAQREFNRLKRTKAQAPVNPFFLECLDFAGNDEFWKTRLIFASRGKFPKNFFLKGRSFCFRDQKKDVSRYLGEIPEEVYENFTSFIRKHSGLSSDLDLEKMNAITKLASLEKKKNCRSVAHKDLYEFLFLCEREWCLSKEQSETLKKTIFFAVKLHGKKCILYDGNGEISGIKGMEEDPETGLFSLNPKSYKSFLNRQSKPEAIVPLGRCYYRIKEEDFEVTQRSLSRLRKNITIEDVLGGPVP